MPCVSRPLTIADAAQKDALADRKKEAEAKKAEAEHTADKRNSQFAIVVRRSLHCGSADRAQLDPSEKINSWESRCVT